MTLGRARNKTKEALRNSFLTRPIKKVFRIAAVCLKPVIRQAFYHRIKKYKDTRKIIYAITPPPNLRNVGDHAQAVAIKKWLANNFGDYPIVEFDKNQVHEYLPSVKRIVSKDDLIFLHSGGNLGDRGLWSETARRLLIENLPANRIISLPQTIFFSNTAEGREQLEISKGIYNGHASLIVMARDHYSFKLAKEYFPDCETMLCPDFVLYLASDADTSGERKNVLLCLRNDSESVIDESARNTIREYITSLNEHYYEYDTTINRNIPIENREKELEIALSLFKRHKLVVTDRLHGMIFSVITRTPCIVLKTVDHKLTESMRWFEDLDYIFYIESHEQLSKVINEALNVDHFDSIDWRGIYFESLKSKLFDDALKDIDGCKNS